MSTRKLAQAFNKLVRRARQFVKHLTKASVTGLLRFLFLLGRQPAAGQSSGFILPTTIMLVLVVSLSIGAITYRSFSRTNDTIADRQQRVVYNAATPAIDRAKAKLEYMFNRERDSRLPSGIPPENTLVEMMLNDNPNNQRLLPDGDDPYTFPADPSGAYTGEERIDLNGDGTNDNAWRYRADTDGNGEDDAWVAYSITFSSPVDFNDLADQRRDALATRADALEIRNAPLSNSNQDNPACATNTGSQPEAGWFPDQSSSTIVRKNFQVDVYVLPDDRNSTVSTLEFQQDREYSRGNKWGAWFRNDLEIFPGPQFNWNGAMHTEGSLIVGNDRFDAYLISSPASCLYTRQASEVTVGDLEDTDPTTDGPQPFQAQVLSGRVNNNSFGNTNQFHLYVEGDAPITGGGAVDLSRATDSVVNTGPAISDYTLDPVFLFTQDRSKPRNVPGDDASAYREDRWNREDDNPFVREGRIYNQSEDTPFVDDSYRADNRFGPNPRIKGIPVPAIGTPIEDALVSPDGTESVSLEDMLRTEALSGDANASNVGLDGYWERRADAEGMKLIVGQRLELGNPVGWGGMINGRGQTAASTPAALSLSEYDATVLEPLRPWTQCTTGNNNRCHEARQRRTLRDNLAAVQAMAVYHSADDSEMPAACVALTVHPGTQETLGRSATFQNLNTGNWGNLASEYPLVISNFFGGVGTNGWEYNVPDEDAFEAGTPLMRALANLANYAGDPNGGSPSFTPVQDDVVHPYPSMAMWGDFSILRRILNSDDGSVADPDFGGYDDLSPADKATLHTAACTLGMLAYNVDYLLKFDYTNATTRTDLQLLATRILQLYGNGASSVFGPTGANVAVIPGPIPANRPTNRDANATNYQFDPRAESFNPENTIAGLKQWRDLATGANRTELTRLVALAELVSTREQVIRDLLRGFNFTNPRCNTNPNTLSFSDPTISNGQYLAALCSAIPKYPILYALLPALDRSDAAGSPDVQRLRDRVDRDDGLIDYIQEVNDADVVYSAINWDPANLTADSEISEIALAPRPRNEWVLPNAAAGTDDTPTHPVEVRIKDCTGTGLCDYGVVAPLVQVPFKDSALMNGREMMSTRVLDIDLDLLRRNTYSGNYWLPVNENDTGGVVYAFREDAVSEGTIVRPGSGGNWGACGNNAALQNNTACRMRAGTDNAYSSTDPPLNDENLISPKPVDYAPDPDRRPHGFRLRKGAVLMRPDRAQSGLTFVSDNPVYIQGNFNLHQTAPGGTRLEEFTQLLPADFNIDQFYGRTTIDDRFARPDTDLWRPVEILADAITVLPDNFCDGSIQDGFLTAGTTNTIANTAVLYNCANNNNATSYLNQNRPSTTPPQRTETALRQPNVRGQRWFRENPLDITSPIMVTNNGNPVMMADVNWVDQTREYSRPTGQTYYAFADNKSLITAQQTRQNAIIVSGLVPSRPNQSYGGLHNFPRFLTAWPELFMSGSFLQLNYSRYATAPFSQAAWEPGDVPPAREDIRYYGAPDRRWGYDVGLQYAPAGPLSSRFISAENTRNEFYNEPPSDDPYMLNLCESLTDVTDATCQ